MRGSVSPASRLWGTLGPWAGLLTLGLWAASVHPGWLVAAAALLVGPVLPGVARSAAASPSGLRVTGILLALAAVPVGFWSHREGAELEREWAAYWEMREQEVFARLTGALEEVVVRGDQAADALALAATGARPPDVARLREIRLEGDFPAAAVYDPDGRLVVWDGRHQGKVPQEVQEARQPYLYGERPLFSYLYFTRPVAPGGGTVMVAALLRSDLPTGLRADLGDLATGLSELTGEEIRITRPETAGVEPAFDFVWRGGPAPDTLFSVTVVSPAPADRVASRLRTWVRVVAGLVAAAWLLLTLAGRGRGGSTGLAVGTLVLLLAVLPLGRILGGGPLFDVATFLLPLPGELPLGQLLALALALVMGSVLVLGRTPGAKGGLGVRLAAAAPVAVGFPLTVLLLRAGTTPGLLAGDASGWIAYQLALTLLLAMLAAAGLVLAGGASRGHLRPAWLTAGGLGAVALGGGAALWVWNGGMLGPWAAAAWIVPWGLASRGLQGGRGWSRALLVWGLAGTLAGTAALPVAWEGRIEARKEVAETRLERLEARVDPYLAFLLERLAQEAEVLAGRGAEPVELLYRSWVDSGLAEEGVPVWLTAWGAGGFPREDLRIGVTGARPVVASALLDSARVRETTLVRRYGMRDAHYVATVPLDGGGVVTAVVPPVPSLGADSPLRPLFGDPVEPGGEALTLVPLLEGDVSPGPGDGVRWTRRAGGWEGETLLEYAGDGGTGGDRSERFRARYLVEMAGPPVLTARATLLLALDLGLLVVVGLLGRALLLGAPPAGARWRPLLTSFRARVTGALFAFFLLSNAIFGTLAYRTLATAAERTTRVLAERAASDAGGIYPEEGQGMELLGLRVGTTLLEYRDGELREGSSEELVELGLYEGWLPYRVWRSLSSGEALLTTEETALGRWAYVTAYRRVLDADILGAPIPLQAGATAVRRQEVAHLLGFAVVAGGVLSLLLALLVGRTLTRPIRTLQVASERVGAGNLDLRLPGDRPDEFGSVFSAFNRMVRRLRHARRELVRTTRRTQAIVEEAATGVVALDPAGRVTLSNARAEELLGQALEAGRPLRAVGDAGDELVRWVQLYFRDGLREAGTEFQIGERRLRVRARRISRDGPPGGAVLSLEDVTDELRAERILAWGQMAQQVAHEVKNPLTPIKLSIQHIRRAFDDRRPDFDRILERNAEAALREIDRLATIASSFARFGAPGQTVSGGPLAPVDLRSVVEEVLALYDTGEGPISFDMEVEEGLPAVAAREPEVKEVLVNLLENARAAIESRGRVRVEAAREGEGVALRVRDDGSGIPAELLPRIFEPHFSTRSAGTGLGLAIVQRVVESWDARVGVESETGRGTVVEIVLRPWTGTEHARMSRNRNRQGGP